MASLSPCKQCYEISYQCTSVCTNIYRAYLKVLFVIFNEIWSNWSLTLRTDFGSIPDWHFVCRLPSGHVRAWSCRTRCSCSRIQSGVHSRDRKLWVSEVIWASSWCLTSCADISLLSSFWICLEWVRINSNDDAPVLSQSTISVRPLCVQPFSSFVCAREAVWRVQNTWCGHFCCDAKQIRHFTHLFTQQHKARAQYAGVRELPFRHFCFTVPPPHIALLYFQRQVYEALS